MAAEQKVQVTVGLTNRQISEATQESKHYGISFSDVIRRWIDGYLDSRRELRK